MGPKSTRQRKKMVFAFPPSDKPRHKETGEEMKDKIKTALENRFRPEFLNRLDEIIIFNPLSPEEIKNIVKIQIELTAKRLAGKGINLKITEPALSFLAKEGYNPNYGARPLKRLIQSKILNKVAELIISKKAKGGNIVMVDVVNNELTVDIKTKSNKAPKAVYSLPRANAS